MFEKILVANRGEIAVRIIRACKELNVRTVAVYSEVDANSMHVQLADEAICIGKGPASESYLRIERLISAAEVTDVDAIHPGYGFLSENAHFADVCENCNIRFIGPSSRAMNALENKAVSRVLAKKAGVPPPPGSEGVVENEQDALATAKRVGYPVMIKAVSGGGGCGMRVAHNDISLLKGFHSAKNEAEKAFGNPGATAGVISFTWANAIVPFNGAIKRWWKKPPHRLSRTSSRICARKWAKRRFASPSTPTIRTPAR
jgi:acetyl-CoA carboxylase biotin carboxylase subunit